MTATVEIPEKIEEAVEKKVADGEYSSKSDFIREATITLLYTVLLSPEKLVRELKNSVKVMQNLLNETFSGKSFNGL